MPVENQQQLRPFRLMPRLKAPRPENIAAIALVVFPVDRPVRLVVFPDQAARERRLTVHHVVREQRHAIEITRFAGRLVFIEAVSSGPEVLFHHVPGFVEIAARFVDARLHRLRIREHDECEAVAMIGRIGDVAAVLASTHIRPSADCDETRADSRCHAPRRRDIHRA